MLFVNYLLGYMGGFAFCYIWMHCSLENKILKEGRVLIGTTVYEATPCVDIDYEDMDNSTPQVILEAEAKARTIKEDHKNG